MPPVSWPAQANRRVQTIPIRPVLRHGAVAGPAPTASGDQGPPGTLLGVVTPSYSGQPAGSKRSLLSPAAQPPPTDLPSGRPRRGNHQDRPATQDHGSNDIGITNPHSSAAAKLVPPATHTRRSRALQVAIHATARCRYPA